MPEGRNVPQSPLNAAFERIATETCSELVRKAAKHQPMTYEEAVKFRRNLENILAGVYFGTDERIPERD